MADTPIIDMHHHLGPEVDYADKLAERCQRLGVVKVCIMGIEREGHLAGFGGNNDVEAAFKKHPDLILGFGHVRLGLDGPEKVDELKDRGFTGLKFIIPRKQYNDESYFPIYERAEALHMPGMFHLGIVARMDQGHHVRVDCNLMRPIYLDSIARTFPDWTLIGAHLGNPWYEEATMSARWNPNLYFDLSGSTLKKKKPEFLLDLLWWDSTTRYGSPDGRAAWEKIVFGSDVDYYEIKDVLHDYEVLMKAGNIRPEWRYAVRYGTAARILGLEG
ncbi:MAG: amidohydrolase family protein [Anaerolineae bacterium]